MTKESTETRLLRLISELITAVTEDTASAVASADPMLKGWELPLARLAGSILRAKIMRGEIDLYSVSADELEETITLSVAEAAGRIIRAKALTALGGELPSPSTGRENLGE